MKEEQTVDNIPGGGPQPVNAAARGRLSSAIRHPSFFLWLYRICRFGLVALFLFAAGAKLSILKAFAANVASLLVSAGINADSWQWPATLAIIVSELLAAILLLVPRTVRLGAFWSALLLIGFSAFALYYVYVLHGEPLECGCFGRLIGSQLGVKTALRNLLLVIFAIIVFVGARGRYHLRQRKETVPSA